MKKQFTKKEIEKRFFALYPNGELFKQSGYWSYTEDVNSRMITLYKVNNLYDLAEALHLSNKEEISAMKKAAGYVSYK